MNVDIDAMDKQYTAYLDTHMGNVQKAGQRFLEQTEGNILFIPLRDTIINNLKYHDMSKYEKLEWVPYRDYFYGDDQESKTINDNFDLAWNLHQKRNPHHWQYWVLIKDSGRMVALDIPMIFIIEMLCDWHSFSAQNKESTAKAFYEENKHKMILSDNTRSIIDTLLGYFSEPL